MLGFQRLLAAGLGDFLHRLKRFLRLDGQFIWVQPTCRLIG
jgi:hypothetical protein